MSRGAKVFFSCAAGAGIGALVALELNTYLWWIGLLVGALMGYLSYDFKRVIGAILVVWNQAVNWRSDRERVKYGAICAFYSLLFLSPAILIIFLFFFAVPKYGGWIYILVQFTLLVIVLALSFFHGYGQGPRAYGDFQWLALRFNVISFTFYLSYLVVKYVPWCLWQVMKSAPWFICQSGRLLWQFFKLIHSEIRVLCAVDAAIGAGIGYLYGNALIGALAGGLIGLLNYEIVSKRWLKLAPANENAS